MIFLHSWRSRFPSGIISPQLKELSFQFLVHRLATNTIRLTLSEKFLFYLHSRKLFNGCQILSHSTFLKHFKGIVLDVHSFWWEIHYHMDLVLLSAMLLFSLAAFKTFLALDFFSLILCLGKIFFECNLFGIHWNSWICKFTYLIKFGKFLHYIFDSNFFFPLFWDTNYTYV